MRLSITHETVYDYQPAVETAQHMAYLTPLNTPTQRLLSNWLEVDPQPAQINSTKDVFGNTRHFFSLQVPHRRLMRPTNLSLPQAWHHTTTTLPATPGQVLRRVKACCWARWT